MTHGTANSPDLLHGYLGRTHRPLNCLVFILPMLVAYEVGCLFYRDDSLAAWHFNAFLEAFGAAGPFLPAVVVVLVMLAWAGVAKDRQVEGLTLAGMAVESLLGVLPLVCIHVLMWRLYRGAVHISGALSAGSGSEHALWPFPQQVLSGIGAGVYEEFMFRLVIMGLSLLVMVDLLRLPKIPSAVAAILAASVLFGLHHYSGNWTQFRWYWFAYYTVAGAYLSVIYVARGFGVAVGVHVCFNVAARLGF